MKKTAFAAMVAALALCNPVQAMEHKAVIEHDVGPIPADYAGLASVTMEQIGSAGGSGRPSSLRCQWNVSLIVERKAQVGPSLQAHRTLTRANVLRGSAPGWCSDSDKGAQQLIAQRRDKLHTQMLAMVAEDRAVILAEADTARGVQPGG